MIDKSAEILTTAINQMRAGQMNDVEISINLVGCAVPVMLEATGSKATADFFRNLALRVEKESDSLGTVN